MLRDYEIMIMREICRSCNSCCSARWVSKGGAPCSLIDSEITVWSDRMMSWICVESSFCSVELMVKNMSIREYEQCRREKRYSSFCWHEGISMHWTVPPLWSRLRRYAILFGLWVEVSIFGSTIKLKSPPIRRLPYCTEWIFFSSFLKNWSWCEFGT